MALQPIILDETGQDILTELTAQNALLQDIADGAEKTAGEVRRSAAGRDWDKYRIEAHSLKALAGTIGADEMFDEAQRHENAARDAEYDYIEEKSEQLARDWEDLCALIRKALQE